VVVIHIRLLHRAPVLREQNALGSTAEKDKSFNFRSSSLSLPSLDVALFRLFSSLSSHTTTTTAPIHHQDNLDGWFVV
jgi:hypothetical protein